MIDFSKISKENNWSLFLDRDGVINERLPGVYINDLRDFIFMPRVTDALAKAADLFRFIFLVTNQQGIAKGLMSTAELDMLHSFMLAEIRKAGGRIDAVYYCPALENDQHPDRKPNPGMALRAQKEFSGVDFQRSVMVGDSPSDILFGQGLGMKTVWVGPAGGWSASGVIPDLVCNGLPDFIEKCRHT